jgi:hypothetical protein
MTNAKDDDELDPASDDNKDDDKLESWCSP